MPSLDPIDLIPRYAFWQDGCRVLMSAIIGVLKLVGEPLTMRNIREFAKHLPCFPCLLVDAEWRKQYCSRCLEKMHSVGNEAGKELMRYFVEYFPSRSYESTGMLLDAFEGILSVLEEHCEQKTHP